MNQRIAVRAFLLTLLGAIIGNGLVWFGVPFAEALPWGMAYTSSALATWAVRELVRGEL